MFSKSYGKGRIFTKVTNIRVDFVSDTFNDLSFFYAQLASSVSHGIFFSHSRDFATLEMLAWKVIFICGVKETF